MSKQKLLIILCAAIFVIGLAGSFFLLNRPHGTWIEIVQENEVLYRLDLADAENQTIEIEYEGRVNIVQIENHKVRMSEGGLPRSHLYQNGLAGFFHANRVSPESSGDTICGCECKNRYGCKLGVEIPPIKYEMEENKCTSTKTKKYIW